MQLSIEQLFKKINEINGMIKLSKQRDELELEYNNQMRDLKEREADLSTHLVDEKLKEEYLQKFVQTENKPALLKLVADFNKAFAKYGNIQINPEIVGEASNLTARLNRQSKIIAAITDSVEAHNAVCNKQNISADTQKIKLQASKKQINSISSKIQELKDTQSSKGFEEEVRGVADRFLNSIDVLHENIQSLPKSMPEDLKNFVEQMHKEHFQDGRVFSHIKNGKLKIEVSKIEKIRVMYDLHTEYHNLKDMNSELNEIVKGWSHGTNHTDELLQEVKEKLLDVKLEDMDENLIIEMGRKIEILKNINSVINKDTLTQVELLGDKKLAAKVTNSFIHAMEYLNKSKFEDNLKITKRYTEEVKNLFNEKFQLKLDSVKKNINKLPDNIREIIRIYLESGNSNNLIFMKKINQLDSFCINLDKLKNTYKNNNLLEISVESIIQNFAQVMSGLERSKEYDKIESLLGEHIIAFEQIAIKSEALAAKTNKLPNNISEAVKTYLETGNLSNSIFIKKIDQVDNFCAAFDKLNTIFDKDGLSKVVMSSILNHFVEIINKPVMDKKDQEVESLTSLLKQTADKLNQQQQAIASIQALESQAEADHKELSKIRDICVAFATKSGQDRDNAFGEFAQSIQASKKFKEKYQNYFSEHEKLLKERVRSLEAFSGDMDSMSNDQMLIKVIELGLFNSDNEDRRGFIAAMQQPNLRAACTECIKKEIAVKIMPIDSVLDRGKKISSVINTALFESDEKYIQELNSNNEKLKEYNVVLNGILDGLKSYRKTFEFFIRNLFSFGGHKKTHISNQAQIFNLLDISSREIEKNIDKKHKLINSTRKTLNDEVALKQYLVKPDGKEAIEKQQSVKPYNRDISPDRTERIISKTKQK